VRLVIRETRTRRDPRQADLRGNLDNLATLPTSRVAFVAGDIAAPRRSTRFQRAPSTAVELAAEPRHVESIDGPRNFVATNTVGAFGFSTPIRRASARRQVVRSRFLP
jgi:dTDP-D-glucose 4,6-dehydratase